MEAFGERKLRGEMGGRLDRQAQTRSAKAPARNEGALFTAEAPCPATPADAS